MRLVLPWVVILLAVAMPPGSAADQFALTGGIPARFSGSIVAESTAALVRAEDPGALEVSGPTSAVQLVQVVRDEVRLLDGTLSHLAPQVSEVALAAPVHLAGSDRVVLHGRAVRITTIGSVPAEEVWGRANAQSSLLLVPTSLEPTLDSTLHARDVRAGVHEFVARSARVEARTSEFSVLGGQVQTGSTVFDLGEVRTDLAPGASRVTTTFVRMLGDDLGVAFDAAIVRSYSQDLLVELDGFAQFPWAEGRVVHGGSALGISDGVLLEGRLGLRALGADAERAPAVSWLGEGDIRRLGMDSAPDAAPVPPAVAAVAGSAALLGAVGLAYYWPVVKVGSVGLLAPLYARLPRDRVLDHAARDHVYERIRSEPGVSANDLAKAVDFGWSTLAYHLRVLERSELVVSVREGRYRRYFDRESGRFANGRKRLVAVLKNAQSLAIATTVRETPGITQKEVSLRFGLSPSSVHWHVKRLEASGLLVRRRDGHHIRYHVGEAWGEIDPSDLVAPVTAGPSIPTAVDPAVA